MCLFQSQLICALPALGQRLPEVFDGLQAALLAPGCSTSTSASVATPATHVVTGTAPVPTLAMAWGASSPDKDHQITSPSQSCYEALAVLHAFVYHILPHQPTSMLAAASTALAAGISRLAMVLLPAQQASDVAPDQLSLPLTVCFSLVRLAVRLAAVLDKRSLPAAAVVLCLQRLQQQCVLLGLTHPESVFGVDHKDKSTVNPLAVAWTLSLSLRLTARDSSSGRSRGDGPTPGLEAKALSTIARTALMTGLRRRKLPSAGLAPVTLAGLRFESASQVIIACWHLLRRQAALVAALPITCPDLGRAITGSASVLDAAANVQLCVQALLGCFPFRSPAHLVSDGWFLCRRRFTSPTATLLSRDRRTAQTAILTCCKLVFNTWKGLQVSERHLSSHATIFSCFPLLICFPLRTFASCATQLPCPAAYQPARLSHFGPSCAAKKYWTTRGASSPCFSKHWSLLGDRRAAHQQQPRQQGHPPVKLAPSHLQPHRAPRRTVLAHSEASATSSILF